MGKVTAYNRHKVLDFLESLSENEGEKTSGRSPVKERKVFKLLDLHLEKPLKDDEDGYTCETTACLLGWCPTLFPDYFYLELDSANRSTGRKNFAVKCIVESPGMGITSLSVHYSDVFCELLGITDSGDKARVVNMFAYGDRPYFNSDESDLTCVIRWLRDMDIKYTRREQQVRS